MIAVQIKRQHKVTIMVIKAAPKIEIRAFQAWETDFILSMNELTTQMTLEIRRGNNMGLIISILENINL